MVNLEVPVPQLPAMAAAMAAATAAAIAAAGKAVWPGAAQQLLEVAQQPAVTLVRTLVTDEVLPLALAAPALAHVTAGSAVRCPLAWHSVESPSSSAGTQEVVAGVQLLLLLQLLPQLQSYTAAVVER